jgi:hypothetical protein
MVFSVNMWVKYLFWNQFPPLKKGARGRMIKELKDKRIN